MGMEEKMRVPVLARPEKTFTIPETSRIFETDPKTVTMVPLTVREEIEAAKAAEAKGGSVPATSSELLRQAVKAINGRPIDWSKDDPEWVEKCSPPARELISLGFSSLNAPGKGDAAAFLASAVVKVTGG